MRINVRRSLVVMVATVTGAAGALALPAVAAEAQVATEGSFTLTGDSGDYISGGLSYSYSVAAGDQLSVSGGPGIFHLSVQGANGDWWYLDLEAPEGRTLQPGTYTGATRYPFNDGNAGLSVDGNGRGCNTLTGSFTIQSYQPGTNGDVAEMQASFEQHCEGATPAARGTVTIGHPAPAPLTVGVAVASDGTFSKLNGRATVHGTVTCDQNAHVTVAGEVTQVKKKVLITGTFTTTVDCTPAAPVDWTATARPSGTTPFQKGNVEVDATASAPNPAGGDPITVDTVATVTLTRA